MSHPTSRVPANPSVPLAGVRTLVIAWIVTLVAGVAARAADVPSDVELRLPPDKTYEHSVGPDSAVVFRHSTHVGYASNRCTECHTKLYRILSPSPSFGHREMNAGGSCGACHDGRHAFDVRVKESCRSCHTGRQKVQAGGAADGSSAFQGPQPFTYPRESSSPGPVTFRHDVHVRGAVRCAACHPSPWAMKVPATVADVSPRIHAGCSRCHDGHKSFDVWDSKSCPRCHAPGKGGA